MLGNWNGLIIPTRVVYMVNLHEGIVTVRKIGCQHRNFGCVPMMNKSTHDLLLATYKTIQQAVRQFNFNYKIFQ